MSTVGKEVGDKLSALTFGWDKPSIQKAVLSDQNERHFLYRIAGVVSGLKPYKDKETGETKFGSLGTFEMMSPSGEVAQGTTFYPPGYIQAMLEANLSEDVQGIRIAYDVYAEYNEKSATSYKFVAFDLLQEGSEGVDKVKEAIAGLALPSSPNAPQLEAPKK